MRPDETSPITDALSSNVGMALTAVGLTAIILICSAVLEHCWHSTGETLDHAPEFEAAHDSRRTIPGPIVQRWSPEIEAQCKEWTDADDAALAELLRGAERPYDWKERGL